MSADRVIEILLAAITLIVGYTSFWLASKTTRVEGKAAISAVDAQAFQRAKDIYEGALETLREELVACRSDLANARSDLATARGEIARLRADLSRIESLIGRLRLPPDATGP